MYCVPFNDETDYKRNVRQYECRFIMVLLRKLWMKITEMKSGKGYRQTILQKSVLLYV